MDSLLKCRFLEKAAVLLIAIGWLVRALVWLQLWQKYFSKSDHPYLYLITLSQPPPTTTTFLFKTDTLISVNFLVKNQDRFEFKTKFSYISKNNRKTLDIVSVIDEILLISKAIPNQSNNDYHQIELNIDVITTTKTFFKFHKAPWQQKCLLCNRMWEVGVHELDPLKHS